MRKTRIFYQLIALFLLPASVAFGQFSMGVKTGLTISDVHVNGAGSFLGGIPKSMVTPGFGITTDLAITENFSLAPELQYIQKGFTAGESFNVDILGLNLPIGGKVYTRLHYVEMPLLAKLKTNGPGVNLYAIGGPSIGYAVKGELDPRVSALIEFDLPNVEIPLDNSIYNRIDIGLVGGAGIEIPTGSGVVFADVRYQHGLTNMLENPLIDVRLKNENVSAGIGYRHYF